MLSETKPREPTGLPRSPPQIAHPYPPRVRLRARSDAVAQRVMLGESAVGMGSGSRPCPPSIGSGIQRCALLGIAAVGGAASCVTENIAPKKSRRRGGNAPDPPL